MSLEIKIDQKDIDRYSSIVPRIDQRNRQRFDTETYETESDGGVNSRIGEAYAGFIQELGKDAFKSTKNDPAEADKRIDTYLSQLFKAFKPEVYKEAEQAAADLDPETKRSYFTNLLEKYVGLPKDVIDQSKQELLNTGDVGSALTNINQIMQHPEYGVSKAIARRDIQKELMDGDGARKMVQYVNQTYLNPLGLDVKDSRLSTIAADTKESMQFIEEMVNGNVNSKNMDKYGIERYQKQ